VKFHRGFEILNLNQGSDKAHEVKFSTLRKPSPREMRVRVRACRLRSHIAKQKGEPLKSLNKAADEAQIMRGDFKFKAKFYAF